MTSNKISLTTFTKELINQTSSMVMRSMKSLDQELSFKDVIRQMPLIENANLTLDGNQMLIEDQLLLYWSILLFQIEIIKL